MSKECYRCCTKTYYDNSKISIPGGRISVKLETSYRGFHNEGLCRQCSINMLKNLKDSPDKKSPLKVLVCTSTMCGFTSETYAYLEITGKYSIDEALELGISELKRMPFKDD